MLEDEKRPRAAKPHADGAKPGGANTATFITKNFATGLWEQNPRWPRQQQGEIEVERCATNLIFKY
jgi:hypothetical protein